MRLQQRHQTHRPSRTLHLLLRHAAALSFLLVAQAALAATNFVPGFEDVPLMPGLNATEEPAIQFDSPGGRIIETQTAGSGSASEVIAFYHETLAELGWHAVNSLVYERQGERLTLTVAEPASGRIEVRFALAPTP
jgi:hypothetical protein